MIDKFAEPNLTKRLDLLANAAVWRSEGPSTSDRGKDRDWAPSSGAIGHRPDSARTTSRAFYARHC